MNILSDFLNQKISDYQKRGLLTLEEANKIVGNYNRIWNSMQKEYFSTKEIDDIAIRAGKK